MSGTEDQKATSKTSAGTSHGRNAWHKKKTRPNHSSGNRNKKPQEGQKGEKTVARENKPAQRKFQGTLPQLPVQKVHEPLPVCLDCGQTIDSIASSFSGPEPGTYRHFDCVVEAIRKEEHVTAEQSISYIGRGTFAVIEKTAERPGFTIVKRIAVEDGTHFSLMKKTVEDTKK